MLVVQNLTFAGNGIVPINGTNAATNKIDVQNVQGSIVDIVAGNNGAPAAQSDLNANQQKAVYADSWWYNSGTGVLQGVIDDIGDSGALTDPNWQLGPIKNVGPAGYTWTSGGLPGVQAGNSVVAALASSGGANATTGQYMMYSGIYGPNGANGLTGPPLASLFVNGQLTVPIAQIATTGNIQLPGTSFIPGGGLPGGQGTGTYIGLIGVGVSNGPTGNGTYNLLGGDPNYNPGFFYSFDGRPILPEPGSIVLAGLGALGILFVRKRR